MPKLYPLLLIIILITCRKKDSDHNSIPPPPYTPIKLDSSSFIIGNHETNVLDTFYLHFNKTVSMDYVKLIDNPCLPTLGYTLVENGKTVKFYNLLCGRLTSDFKFEFLVHDQQGKTLKDTVKFSYYSRRFPTQGQIMNFFVTADSKYCWISTKDPNRIYCFGLDDTAYIKKYDFNFTPGKMVLNPINQKLYIVNYPFYSSSQDKIFVMNPITGIIEKTITVMPDSFDDPQKHITASDLDFGYNGYGILMTGTVEYGNTRWRILDSRFNDTIYAHPAWISSISNNLPFSLVFGPQANYNKTKIYMRREYSIGRGAVMDCDNQTMTELQYPTTNPNHYIAASKTQDKLFVASYLYQAIIGNGAPNNYSTFDDRYSQSADFSYRPNEQNIIYYSSSEYSSAYEFMILDYNNSKTLMRVFIPSDLNHITATLNGKYMLASSFNSIFVFSVDMLYKSI